MSEYAEAYEFFENILGDCKKVSVENAGIRSPTSAHYYASLLFSKLCTAGVTLLSICPSASEIGGRAHWDCSSVATLTRGLLETYLVFQYLCIEECDPKEWEARWRLMNLHDHASRLKMFMVMKGGYDQAAKFKTYLDDVKSDLTKTEHFQSLTDKQKLHYLKGNNAFFKSQDEIVESFGGDVNEFRFRYRLLSNHAHSYPMSFYRMTENGQGTGAESQSEISRTIMFLLWAGEYLSEAKLGYAAMWSFSID